MICKKHIRLFREEYQEGNDHDKPNPRIYQQATQESESEPILPFSAFAPNGIAGGYESLKDRYKPESGGS